MHVHLVNGTTSYIWRCQHNLLWYVITSSLLRFPRAICKDVKLK